MDYQHLINYDKSELLHNFSLNRKFIRQQKGRSSNKFPQNR